METMLRHKPHQSHSLMGYPETTGATSRKIKPYFATDRTVNYGDPGLGGVRELIELYSPMGGCAGEQRGR